jgi:lipopolysaccharide assembly outer membrane protein LptD (OstA)
MYADRMDAYFISSDKKRESGSETNQGLMGSKIDKIIARGNVRVVRGENTSYSQEAIYSASDKKLTLTGRPKLVIFSTEELGEAPAGN